MRAEPVLIPPPLNSPLADGAPALPPNERPWLAPPLTAARPPADPPPLTAAPPPADPPPLTAAPPPADPPPDPLTPAPAPAAPPPPLSCAKPGAARAATRIAVAPRSFTLFIVLLHQAVCVLNTATSFEREKPALLVRKCASPISGRALGRPCVPRRNNTGRVPAFHFASCESLLAVRKRGQLRRL